MGTSKNAVLMLGSWNFVSTKVSKSPEYFVYWGLLKRIVGTKEPSQSQKRVFRGALIITDANYRAQTGAVAFLLRHCDHPQLDQLTRADNIVTIFRRHIDHAAVILCDQYHILQHNLGFAILGNGI